MLFAEVPDERVAVYVTLVGLGGGGVAWLAKVLFDRLDKSRADRLADEAKARADRKEDEREEDAHKDVLLQRYDRRITDLEDREQRRERLLTRAIGHLRKLEGYLEALKIPVPFPPFDESDDGSGLLRPLTGVNPTVPRPKPGGEP